MYDYSDELQNNMKQFNILTLFPELIEPYISGSILGKARDNNLIDVKIYNWRDYATDKHNTVDDKPYGGGAGMLLQVEPIYRQLQAINAIDHDKKTRVIMMSPKGQQFDQKQAKRLSGYDRLILLSGRYEGFDARVDEFVDEKISVGPYVLAGGELPAMIVLEAVARYTPGVVGHEKALVDETFSHADDYVEYPQYTRPEIFTTDDGRKLKVPEVLLSGDHKKIEQWKKDN